MERFKDLACFIMFMFNVVAGFNERGAIRKEVSVESG